MQSIVVTACWIEIVALVAGAILSIALPGNSDAAGRAMAQGYIAIGVTALLILFVLPALLLASSGRVLWLAAILCGIAAIPALVLAIGSLVSAAEYLWSR